LYTPYVRLIEHYITQFNTLYKSCVYPKTCYNICQLSLASYYFKQGH